MKEIAASQGHRSVIRPSPYASMRTGVVERVRARRMERRVAAVLRAACRRIVSPVKVSVASPMTIATTASIWAGRRSDERRQKEFRRR